VNPPSSALPGLRYSQSAESVWFESDSESVHVRIPSDDGCFAPENFDVRHAAKGLDPRTFAGAEHRHFRIGEGNHLRDVYHWIVADNGVQGGLRVGLTVHTTYGTQSSLPHDFELSPAPGFQEVFFYMIRGGRRRAVQVGTGMWHDGVSVDAAWTVEDRTFSPIPMGYHPVLAEPESRVSYLWAYLCARPEWEKAK
jgi:5-deoxy-D-glucuronate isomerase